MCSFVRRIVYEFDCFRGEIYNVREFVTIVSTIIVFDVDGTVERVQLLLQELLSLWQAVFFSLHRVIVFLSATFLRFFRNFVPDNIFVFFSLFSSRKRALFQRHPARVPVTNEFSRLGCTIKRYFIAMSQPRKRPPSCRVRDEGGWPPSKGQGSYAKLLMGVQY